MIFVSFQHDGRPVQFVAGETMTCNSVGSKRFTSSFEGEFATASIAGKNVELRV